MKKNVYISLKSNKFPGYYFFCSYSRMVRYIRDMLDNKNEILLEGCINNEKSRLGILAYKINNGLWLDKHIHICYYDRFCVSHCQDIVYSGQIEYLADCLR